MAAARTKKARAANTKAAPKAAPEAVFRPFARLGKPTAAKAEQGEPADRKPRQKKPGEPKASEQRTPARAPRDASDDLAFDAHMHGVQPLAQRARRIPATASSIESATAGHAEGGGRGAATSAGGGGKRAAVVDRDEEARRDLALLVGSQLRFEVLDDGAFLEGRRLDVDPRELRRLRRRSYAIDGKLDLHGHDLHGAREAVVRFVGRRRSQGDRAVLIVHGKGSHSPRGVAVLRGELGAWLSQGVAAKDVLAFASVPDDDSGPEAFSASGAVLVLLAKR